MSYNIKRSTLKILYSQIELNIIAEAVKSTPKSTVSTRVSPIKEKSGEKKLIVLKRPAEQLAEDQEEEGI